MKLRFELGLIFLLCIGAIGCSTSSDNSAHVVPDDNGSAAASCEFKSDEGGPSSMSLLSARKIERAAFAKEYNRSKLEGILTASVNETLGYVQADRVSVFKKENDGRGCSIYAQVAAMPNGVVNYWESVQDKVLLSKVEQVLAAKEKVRIMGLYVGKTSKALEDSEEKKPFIIVRENSTRWTLVHEFMHHLFMSSALEKGHDDQAMIARLRTAIQRLNKFSEKDLKVEDRAKAAIEAALEYSAANDDFLLHYYLEEMTIEDQLRKDYRAGNLKYVTEYDYQNAGWYIRYSADNFEKFVDPLKELAKTITDTIQDSDIKESSKAALIEKLSPMSQLVKSRSRQVSEVKSRNSEDATTAITGGIQKKIYSGFHAPCEHALPVDELVDQLKGINEKLKGGPSAQP